VGKLSLWYSGKPDYLCYFALPICIFALIMSDSASLNTVHHPKISIIIVTLNVAGDLQNCLDSVYRQQYPAIEIVIMDGGSTDGTVDILKANDAKIACWKSEKDGGIYEAMNKALDFITGDWVYFLGADDVLFDDFSTLGYQLKNNSLIYYGSVLMDGKKFRGETTAYQHSKSAICHQAIIYPKRVFEKYRFNTKYRISADHELNMRAWKDEDFTFFYVDLVIAKFNHTGVSSLSIDEDLERDKSMVILKNHGFLNWARYKFRMLKGMLFPKKRKSMPQVKRS
jgi:glycosyltransferase involved in cell wall biosynthesis